MPYFHYFFHWALALLLLVFGVGGALIAFDGLNDKIALADVAVVPGNTVNPDGTLSPRLKARLDAALKLFKTKQCAFVLVSGATGKEGVDEAAAMKLYLIAAGVPAERVIQDSAGVNTEATAKNTEHLLREKNLKSVVVATQFFHIPRLRALLAREGVKVVGNAHAQYFELRDAYSLAREVIAMLAMWLRP